MELTLIPPLQGIRVPKKDATLPAWRNFFDFEEASLLDGLRKGALYFPYKQKVQYTDRQTFYFFTNAYYTGINAAVYLAIVDRNGIVIEEHDPVIDPQNFITTAYTYKSGDIEEETDAFAFRWRYSSGTYPEGEYYIYLKITYHSGNTEEFLSEPQWVRTKHKKTARIDFTNLEDAEEVLFYTLGLSFSVRIDSEYMKLVPKGEETTYTEQDEELRRIYGKYYRCLEFFIKRAPEYMIDMLGRILLNCNSIFIENKRFLKDAGAEIEYERNNNNAVGTGKVTLREYYGNRSGLFLNNSVTILTRPGTFPYMVGGFILTNGITWGIQNPIEIADAGEETDWLNSLNTDVIDDMDASGTFSWDGDDLIYANGPGEYFVLQVINPVFSKSWEYTIGSVVNTHDVKFSYVPLGAGWSGYAVFDDTAKGYYPLLSSDVTNGEVISHRFAAGGTKTARIYSYSNMRYFVWGSQPQGQTGKVTGVTGGDDPTARIEITRLMFQNIGGAFDPFALLQNSSYNVRDISVYKNGITSITTTGLQAQNQQWKLLKTIQIADNNMNQAALDAFINDFEQYSGYTYGGYMYIRQIGGAVPGAASLTARNRMIAAGWQFIP